MTKPVVTVTRNWPEEVEREIQKHFEARLNPDDAALSSDQLQQALQESDALFSTVTDRVTADVLSVDNRRVKLIGNFGVGFNNIDIEAARSCGLVVTNTPDVLTDATADLAMTLLLMAARRCGEGERHLRSGSWIGWRPTQMLGTQVTGKTLGIVGLGRIGQAVARRARHGFKMRILFFDPYPPPSNVQSELEASRCSSLGELLDQSDFVSLHCPATAENRHLINAERLRQMRSEAYLINSARGDIVDEQALLNALRAKEIAGAGLDVFEREPAVAAGLLELENVVLLPHLGSATRETRVAMGLKVLENALAFFDGVDPPNRVA